MFSRIQQKILGIKYIVDVCEQKQDILTIKGWIFSTKYKLKDVHFMVEDNEKHRFALRGSYKIKRNDVYQVFQKESALKSGFYVQALIENVAEYSAWIVFLIGDRTYRIYLGKIVNEDKIIPGFPSHITEIDTTDQGLDIVTLLKKQEEYKFFFPEKFYSECIDIIIPVYNGYKFLDNLLTSVSKTKLNYRLIIINDKSPDERVGEYLENYAKDKDNVILLSNEENLGFVRTVNRGFGISEHHVALVNTDVELPEMWLERLMLPILQDPKVASTTPYTTCGTICSFPNFGQDNKLFMNLEIQQIDDEFRKISPEYTEMPTGVGFCMGMNKEVLQSVGLFDAESFGKGYGEENDWCQRAIEHGYKNVHVENLFVFHNHGGSFLSEDKKRYLKEHEKVLLEKHPYYNKDIAKFCTLDPNKEIREFVKLNLLKKYQKRYTILAFDHNLGGGASKYLMSKKDQHIREGNDFVILRYDFIKNSYAISYYYKQDKLKLYVKKQEDLMEVIKYLCIDEMWINELVTYPKLYELLDEIRIFSQKNHLPVKMLIHDFFVVCPTINLLDHTDHYCEIPDCKTCDYCLTRVNSLQSLDYESMEKWRQEWRKFLEICREIVVFSDDSRDIMERAFGKFTNIVVCPHQIDYIPNIKKQYKTTDTLNIGLLGVLTKHKGKTLVSQMTQIIEQEKLQVRIVLIGSVSGKINSPVFKETGTYTRDSIPRLLLENDIDIFLIPSIWPETFSYTTEEIMTMGMPIMCFDIGAPAERVKKYEKGIIIPEISAEAVIRTIKNNSMVHNLTKMSHKVNRILFVVEDITFSSRYRVDHLREQLLHEGVPSDCITLDGVPKCRVDGYSAVVIYRVSKCERIRKMVDKAHRRNLKVYYDMDDYIFDYSAIKNLSFLDGKDYVGFEQYSNNIYETMKLCDAYIVSTVNLKKAVEEKFPGKEVLINRNVASMEMLTISLGIKKEADGIIRLGYFSGSKTHNEDFESIKDTLLEIMERNENVHLLIAGKIKLPVEFDRVKDQVEKFNIVFWKKLPGLIAKADINLMPLQDTFFHACKSENKWMEAAFVHVPTIASWNSELAGVIEDGVNGYLCKNQKEWEEKLQKLIDDELLRKKLADHAYECVLENYTTFSVEPEILNVFSK